MSLYGEKIIYCNMKHKPHLDVVFNNNRYFSIDTNNKRHCYGVEEHVLFWLVDDVDKMVFVWEFKMSMKNDNALGLMCNGIWTTKSLEIININIRTSLIWGEKELI